MRDPRNQYHEAVVERLIARINDRRIEVMDELFHEGAVMDWPQSGERVVGGVNRRTSTAPSRSCRRSRPDGC